MTQDHCAFCDAFPLDDQSLEPIEHFRPKHDQRFQHLAYTWSNLYYCCGRCQGEKGAKWDDLLLAPDEPGYVFEDHFEFDVASGQIRPSRFAAEPLRSRAEATIDIFGLNRGNRPTRRKEALARWLSSSSRCLDDTPHREFIRCGSAAADTEMTASGN